MRILGTAMTNYRLHSDALHDGAEGTFETEYSSRAFLFGYGWKYGLSVPTNRRESPDGELVPKPAWSRSRAGRGDLAGSIRDMK